MAEKVGGYTFGAPEEEPEKPDREREQWLSWRFDQLVRAGFDPRTAEVIADRRDIDLHKACDLCVSAGPGKAADILL